MRAADCPLRASAAASRAVPRFVSIATFGLALAAPAVATAEPVFRPGLDGSFVKAEDALAGGGRLSFATGYNLEYEPLLIVPELQLTGGIYGGDTTGYAFRGTVGMRFGFSYTFEPSIFLRGGFAHDTLDIGVEGGELTEGLNGGSVQTGLAFDFRLSREMTLGPAFTYDAGLFDGPGRGVFVVHTMSLGLSFAYWLQ